ncbi:sensor histidine kinase [Rubrivivax albus]|uniref:histidine kinase n=1 Tax=Rubrivivax albus TaxID=2499835 RepID=A0A3S2UN86_9BURK|nr:HAMP domain-containing sensor histidine kinase [Rubrivivax albus]RVT49700.1 HAMP domain-containing histidine kinase [Rubrivivax albus]
MKLPRLSLRWRLVGLFLALALASTVVFLGGLQRAVAAGWQTWAQPLLGDYVDRLAADLGSPPDPARAAALEARLPVRVRIEGPVVRYDGSRAPYEESRRRHRDDDDDSTPFALVRTTADGHRITLGLAAPPDGWRPRGGAWVPLTVLLVCTALAYALVRRWLAPLDAIGAGAERYGRGRFDTPIAARRGDELGRLADRIDAMAASLHGMLQAQRTQLLAVSHELRSPLTRARLNAELLPDGPEKDAVVRDLAEMRDLIADLLESERLAAGAAALTTETVDLGALVREAAADAGAKPSVAAGLGTVQADPARLGLLLRNLLANARRHAADAPRPPVLFLRRADEALELGLRDFGPGVPPEALAHLAEPFYRPDSARTRAAGGVGLGMHLCRRVAEAHGGTLVVRNAAPGLEVVMRWTPGAD